MNTRRRIAALLACVASTSMAGCCIPGARSRPEPMPPGTPPPRQGMSTRNKILLIGGAAALYYLYKKHQNAQGAGPQGQYYRSKNGRVYYRDAKGSVHWVTEPSQPIQVPADEYERMTGQPVGNPTGVIRQAPAGW